MCGPTDMRKQINGLSEIVYEFGSKRLKDNDYYVFCGRNRRTTKILYYEDEGYCLLQKKYEKAIYWPMDNLGLIRITEPQLKLLFAGVDIWKNIKVAKDIKPRGFNKLMMWPLPNKELLNKVIAERKKEFNQQIITGFVQENGGTFYIDRRGLVHKSGPHGEVVSFVGWTNEQLEEAKNNERIMPIPR
jgi:transposase